MKFNQLLQLHCLPMFGSDTEDVRLCLTCTSVNQPSIKILRNLKRGTVKPIVHGYSGYISERNKIEVENIIGSIILPSKSNITIAIGCGTLGSVPYLFVDVKNYLC